MTISIKHLSSLLFIVTIFSVFFNQLTFGISTRISIPFRYIEILIFLSLIFFYVVSLINKRENFIPITTFILFLWLFLVFIGNILVNIGVSINETPFIFISFFIWMHSLVIIYFFSTLRKNVDFIEISTKLLKFHLFFSIFLYLIYLMGLNPLSFGVHDPADNWPRMRGLFPEPSHYSIFAWITFMYFFLIDTKSNLMKIISFLAFTLSISATGVVFALTNIFFIFLFRNFRYFFYLIPFSILLFFIIPENYFMRDVTRVYQELLLINEFLSNSNWQNFDYTNGSRVILFLTQFYFLEFNPLILLFGMGPGGQTILLDDLQDVFNGPIYIIAEFGLIGFILISYFFLRIYKSTNIIFRPLILSYVFISFFNPPGGNFGLDFLLIIYFIHIISLKLQPKEEFDIIRA